MSKPNTYRKAEDEVRTYEFDFSEQVEIATNGETIVSVDDLDFAVSSLGSVLVDATPIVLGSPSLATVPKVQFTVSDGTDGVTYIIWVLVTTSGGSVLKEFGYLTVYDRS